MKNHKTTRHAQARLSQRGISSSMVAYVLKHGTDQNDKLILDRQATLQRLAAVKEEERLLMKILDKGGVVVVADGETIITTYNRSSRSRRAPRQH